MEDAELDANTTWQAVPGWVLFAFLTLIAADLVLIPSDPDVSPFEHWTRISPFMCLYDICQRLVEIGLLLCREERPVTRHEPVDVFIRSHSYRQGDWSRTPLRFAASLSLLALVPLRHARGTQLIAALYLGHWFMMHVINMRPGGPAVTYREFDRVASILFTIICHVFLTGEGLGGFYLDFANIAALCAGVGLSWLYANGIDGAYDLMALGFQLAFLSGCGWVWLMLYSPLALKADLPQGPSTGDNAIISRALVAIVFHFSTVAFLASRRSLTHARPTTKALVGLLWLGVGAAYYCHFYGVYATFGVPQAERPSIVHLIGLRIS